MTHNEAELLEFGLMATAAQVERLVRAWRRADCAEEMAQERARHEARALTLYIDDDGSYVIRGRLDPEVGAVLQRADAAAEALGAKNDRERNAAQRRGDALRWWRSSRWRTWSRAKSTRSSPLRGFGERAERAGGRRARSRGIVAASGARRESRRHDTRG